MAKIFFCPKTNPYRIALHELALPRERHRIWPTWTRQFNTEIWKIKLCFQQIFTMQQL